MADEERNDKEASFDGKAFANMLHAQRDYFGAHTNERITSHRGQFFHSNWTDHGGTTSSTPYDA